MGSGKTPTVSLNLPYRDRACNNNNVSILYSKDCVSSTEIGLNCAPFATAFANGGLPSIDWGQFKDWLLRKKLNAVYVERLVIEAERWCHCLFSGRLSAVEFSGSKHMVLSALSQLSKFLGQYSYFKRLKEESGLKWHDSDNGSVFEKIYCGETAGIEDWLRKCHEKLSYEDWFGVKWLALSGLRTGEGYKSLDIVRTEGLDGYLNKELGVLEHFRHGEAFLRRSKKAYLTVVNDDILEELESYSGDTCYWKLKKRLQKLGMRVRTYDLRKNWASFMAMNGVPESVVDLFQGRCGTSIFQKSYFRPKMSSVTSSVRNVLGKYMTKLEI